MHFILQFTVYFIICIDLHFLFLNFPALIMKGASTIKANIKDVAKKAGVSITSVSLVLNEKPNNVSELTKQRIYQAAKELNYIPNYFAKSLKTNKSKVIGVLLPTLTNPFFAAFASQLNYLASKVGYTILINEYNHELLDVQDAIGIFLKYNVAGVIIIQFNLNEEISAILSKLKIPFVIADNIGKIPEKEYSSVLIDNFEGGFLATEHLINNGHKKIGCYTGSLEFESTKARIRGYKSALNKHNITEEFYFEGNYGLGKEDEALEYFLANQCTAIFSLNDVMALGLYKAARKKQIKIPEKVSIIGFDNIDVAELVFPELTTIDQSLNHISENAVNILIESIKNYKFHKNVLIQPKLISRNSVLDITDK